MTTSDDKQHLLNFYSVLEERLKSYREAKQRLDRFLSTDFNVFKWFFEWTKWKEDFLSDIIADMLNPAGSHGQDRIFLDAFLHLDAIRRHIKPNDLDSLLKQQPHVTCESYTVYIENSRRRIDILVDFKNFGLGIENKPWAVDQENQVQDYSRNLQKNFKGKFCLVYITPDGCDPSGKSITARRLRRMKKNGKLICASYSNDILEWVRECCQLCESDKFRWFLRDFMDYIPTMEGSMSNSSERKKIVEHALENEENLDIALNVHWAYNELRRLISEDFHKDLQRCLEKHLNMSQWEFIPLEDDSLFGFAKKAWGQRYIIGTELYLKEDSSGVYLGVYKKNPTTQKIKGLKRALDMSMKGKSDKSDKYWEWYCDLKPHWDSEKALVEIKYNRDAIKEELCKRLADISKNREAMELIDKYVIDHPTES